MRLNLLVFIVIITMNWTCVNAEILTNPLEVIKNSDSDNRAQGFYDLVKLDSVSERITYNCEFNISDSNLAKEAVIELLHQENRSDFEKFYRNKYGVRILTSELHKYWKNENVKKYLYALEAYGEYLSDLMLFVDSCEDKSAIDLFPGERTFSKYPKKSTELVMLELDKPKIKHKNNFALVRLVGASAKQYRENDKEFYVKVKAWLIRLIDDGNLNRLSVFCMGEIGDEDFIPILEKISQYDDSKGKVIGVVNDKKIIRPISVEAKKALEKIKKHLVEQEQQKKEKSLKKSTIEQIKK